MNYDSQQNPSDLNNVQAQRDQEQPLDAAAQVGRFNAEKLAAQFENQGVFDTLEPEAMIPLFESVSMQTQHSLPFDNEWIVNSFRLVAQYAFSGLTLCVRELSTPGFTTLQEEIEVTIVPRIWNRDFNKKWIAASAQLQTRNDAIMSCIQAGRYLSDVSAALKTQDMLCRHVERSRMFSDLKAVDRSVNRAHSACIDALTDSAGDCLVIAKAHDLTQPTRLLRTLIELAPRPTSAKSKVQLLAIAATNLREIESALASPPFATNSPEV
jgi:hypothetical protein